MLRSCGAMMRASILLTVLLTVFPLRIYSITTYPETAREPQIPVSEPDGEEEEIIPLIPINRTVVAQMERQRRLIPYMTFYITRNLNRPSSHQQQTQQLQSQPHQYRLVPHKVLVQPHQQGKYIIANYRPKYPEPQPIIYEQKFAYTPFLESNKLPGGFTPIRTSQPIRIHVVNSQPEPPINKEPNYSTIFDKLVQLKQLEYTKTPPYIIPVRQQKPNTATQYFTRNYATQRPPAKIVTIENYEENRYKNVEPTKTYIHTYTPSNIDIPADNKVKNYENFESLKTYNQIPAPATIKNYEPQQNPVHNYPIEVETEYPQPETQTVNKQLKPIIVRPVYRPVAVPTPFKQYYQPHEFKTPQETYTSTENPNALNVILKQLQDSNTLPHTLTPDNIDNSIKTLVQILNALKRTEKFQRPIVVSESGDENNEDYEDEVIPGTITQSYPAHTPEGGTPGKPGVDYPAYSFIPQTSFNCKKQRYKGFFGDPDTNCQVWHYCDLNGGQASFLCPNGTIFSQVALTCDWWYNVKCATTTQLYVLNERLYKYILPFTPKFPEDYSGPLVDRYLALKFKEMEEKMRKQKKGKDDKGEDVKESDKLQDIETETERTEYTTLSSQHINE